MQAVFYNTAVPRTLTVRGVIVYCINPVSGDLYHRFFSEKSRDEIASKVAARAFSDVDFPPLEILLDPAGSSIAPVRAPYEQKGEETITEHPVFGTIAIENRSKGYRIALFCTHFLEQ
jgi:hypothetical protein